MTASLEAKIVVLGAQGIWDTAGQERFRSISRLYYRGANACILCYSITSQTSFTEMSVWLTELRRNLPADIILHVVGTKADLVAKDPSGTPPSTALALAGERGYGSWGGSGGGLWGSGGVGGNTTAGMEGARSPSSKKNAESGEGVEEVFRVITRKLVEQNNKIKEQLLSAAQTPGLR
ncbi:hypothetical protein DID88_000081 [Monilinia fructigena]|uniref:Uncharacterized protein n=1 Tax=Monilinia fructigena TaxID=38457 RepID=A0A395IJA8_9HELO|nr:hypothetical protein DID88_000081 [Monilinia fructigena]